MALTDNEQVQLAVLGTKLDGLIQLNTLQDERIKNLSLQIEHSSAMAEGRARQFESSLGAHSTEFAKHVGDSEVRFVKEEAKIESVRTMAVNQHKAMGAELQGHLANHKSVSGLAQYVVNAIIAAISAGGVVLAFIWMHPGA